MSPIRRQNPSIVSIVDSVLDTLQGVRYLWRPKFKEDLRKFKDNLEEFKDKKSKAFYTPLTFIK